MSDDQAFFSTAGGTDRDQVKLDCAKCINFGKASEQFKANFSCGVEAELTSLKGRLAAA